MFPTCTSAKHFSIARRKISNWLPFSVGIETHNARVVNRLAHSLRSQNRKLTLTDWMLVASGDLTTLGGVGAFDLAFEYLRGASVNGQTPRLPHSLGCPDAPVVPGNHDIWGGSIFNMTGRSPQTVRTAHFTPPTPALPPSAAFPCVLPLSTGVPAVSLYGLDSTEIEAFFGGGFVNQFKAIGYVSPAQLQNLKNTIASEPKDELRLRIAVIHHPLAYRTTTGAGNTKALQNLDDVLKELQNMGIALALCGHTHHGFIRPMCAFNSSRAPVYVLSAGTATQTVPAGAAENNEYRLYDFALQPNETEKIEIKVRSFRYGLFGVKKFTEDKSVGQTISLDLNDYKTLVRGLALRLSRFNQHAFLIE